MTKERFNIQERINGAWVTRYRDDLTWDDAQAKYDWLTTTDYWLEKADNFRIVEFIKYSREIKRYKP